MNTRMNNQNLITQQNDTRITSQKWKVERDKQKNECWIYDYVMFAPWEWDECKKWNNKQERTHVYVHLEGRQTVKYIGMCQWHGLQSQSLCRLYRLNSRRHPPIQTLFNVHM